MDPRRELRQRGRRGDVQQLCKLRPNTPRTESSDVSFDTELPQGRNPGGRRTERTGQACKGPRLSTDPKSKPDHKSKSSTADGPQTPSERTLVLFFFELLVPGNPFPTGFDAAGQSVIEEYEVLAP
jgi:hypothetical protein